MPPFDYPASVLGLPAPRVAPALPAAQATDPAQALKRGIWLYFFLLLFEGGLRKWFLPALATPLLIVRDPVAVWLVVQAWRRGLLPANFYLSTMLIISIVSFFATMLLGHGNLYVAIYGARILLFHFPVMFVIGRAFDRRDVVQMGKALVWIAIPMGLLIALQFYSPQSAWVNRGLGGDTAGSGFDGALGYFRPPGTFSFTNGTHLFFGLVTCFVCYFWTDNRANVNRLALIGATISLLSAIPFSISRSLLLYAGVVFLYMVLGMLRKPENIGRIIMILVAGAVLLAILSQVSFLQAPIAAFTTRFTNASDAEGGLQGTLGDRYLGGILQAFTHFTKQPFFGYGLGMGTNAGNKLMTGNNTGYLISEEEWGRMIGEMGFLLGIAAIALRVGLSAKIALACYRKLVQNDLLPWILLGYTLLTIPGAQWAQPTTLGFSTLIGGLVIASLRTPLAEPTAPQHLTSTL